MGKFGKNKSFDDIDDINFSDDVISEYGNVDDADDTDDIEDF